MGADGCLWQEYFLVSTVSGCLVSSGLLWFTLVRHQPSSKRTEITYVLWSRAFWLKCRSGFCDLISWSNITGISPCSFVVLP